MLEHINILGLKAIKIGIYTYCKNLHVELRYGNVTAVSCVNTMGDIKSQTCNDIAYRIWDFCDKNY